MKTLFFTILILLCTFNENQSAPKKHRSKREAFSISSIIAEIRTSRFLLKETYFIWKRLRSSSDLSSFKKELLKNENHEIIQNLNMIHTKLSRLDNTLSDISDTITTTILQALPKVISIELRLHELSTVTSLIDFSHKQLKIYLSKSFKNLTSEEPDLRFESRSNEFLNSSSENDELIESTTLQDFATWAVSHQFNSVPVLLHRLHDLVVPKKGIFELLNNQAVEMQSNICNLKQSPHQVLYNLYNTVELAALKGNVVLQLSYMLLKLYNKGNFTTEAEIARNRYNEQAKEKLEVARKALMEADRSIFKCDPLQYVEGVSYVKLTKLLQGYIENEVNLNPYGTCRENCQYYTYTNYYSCFKNKFCAHQPQCRGKIIDCKYVDSDMNICRSSNPERRYEWIEYENGRMLGNKGVCEKRNFFQVDSWWRYLFWHCSYCLCLCDENDHTSDRYFNLREVTSDIENNKVVTGVKIVKVNQIIHMQIQQGVLMPRGVIEKSSLSWKPVDNYTINDDNIENNVDIHTMNWLERAIDMDEVIAPSEHVVTGIRFRKVGTHLNLEIRITPINFTTGEVFNTQNSYWLGNDNTEASLVNPRTEIVLKDPDIPIRKRPHSLNSKHDQYIQFQSTSFETDAGQSTVPFLDSQILTSQETPISGIGLIHRGKTGSGGFIAPKLISYDFTPHLNIEEFN